MRKALLPLLLLLLAVPSFAQSSPEAKPLRLSVFASNFGFGWSEAQGLGYDAGIGAALEYRWNQRWSLELSVSAEDNTNSVRRIEGPGVVLVDSVQDTTYPLDLIARYNFRTDSRWHPFLGGGLRHVQGPRDLPSRTSLEVEGGVFFDLTRNLSLRVDAKRLLHDESFTYDPVNKTAIGIGWRF